MIEEGNVKKNITIVVFLFISFGFLSAADKIYDHPLKWYAPEVMGQGGSATANIEGYNSLFYNPAGFCGDFIDINVITLQSSWDMDVPVFLGENSTKGLTEAMLNQVTENGLGLNLQSSIGFVGHGIGAALFGSIDSNFPQTDSIIGAQGDIWATTGLILGYAHGFNFADVELKVGADVRPMYRVLLDDIDVNAISAYTGSSKSDGNFERLTGFGLGFDFGVQTTWKDFSLGLVLKDIGGTRFNYSRDQVNSNGSNIADSKSDVSETYLIPMTAQMGVAYSFEILQLIEPTVHIDYTLPLVDADNLDGYTGGTIWTNLSFGTEIELFKILDVRAGVNGGYFSLGLGVDILIFEINGAIYSQEKGLYAGNSRTMGGAFEVSVRL